MTPPNQSRLDHALLVLQSLAEILIVALFVTTFVVQPAHIPTASMQPTLNPGDLLLVDRQSFTPEHFLHSLLPPTALHHGDIAVFRFPLHPRLDLAKRIVALPGDRLQLRDGVLSINGDPVREPYARHDPTAPDPFRDDFPTLRTVPAEVDPHWWAELRRTAADGTLTVPPGSVFVLGDNRDRSDDSRYWGFVPIADLIGRPILVYLPKPHLLH